MKFFMVTLYFTVFSSMDKLAMVTRINQLKKDHPELYEALAALQSNNKKHCSTCIQTDIHVENFSVKSTSNPKIKTMFQYYTWITYL